MPRKGFSRRIAYFCRCAGSRRPSEHGCKVTEAVGKEQHLFAMALAIHVMIPRRMNSFM